MANGAWQVITRYCLTLSNHQSSLTRQPLTFPKQRERGIMKTFRRLLFLAGLVSLVLPRSEAQAQAPAEAPPDKLYTRDHHFILPLLLDDKERAVLQDVQLYVKNGANGVWLCKDTVPATKTGFDFRVPQDG